MARCWFWCGYFLRPKRSGRGTGDNALEAMHVSRAAMMLAGTSCCRVIGLAAAIGLSGPAAPAVADGPLRVVEVTWARGVSGRSPVEPLPADHVASKPILFWTRVAGSEEALEVMRSEGRLPLWHRWESWIGHEIPDVDTLTPDDEKELAVGGIDFPDSLAREVAILGRFDWRTWSRKRHVWPGVWAVQVVDARGDPLPCDPGLILNQRGCRFMITLDRKDNP